MKPARAALPLKTALLAAGLFTAAGAQAADLEVHVTLPGDAGPLASVVYAMPNAGHLAAPVPGTVAIDQINRQFVPQVSVIQTGTAVSFPNKDDIRHHVYSFSPAKPFELKLYSGKPSKPVVFDKAGVVTLGCNIHDVMLGYVVVVDTPYHAVADAHGVAQLRGLPAGDYTVHAWTPGMHRGEHPTQSIHLEAEASGPMRVDVAAVADGAH